MALQFICDYCDTKYKARPSLKGVSYVDGNQAHPLDSDTDPCINCDTAAEQAKKEALEKRKKK